MTPLEQIFLIMLAVQLVHSMEELSNGFHEKFPLFKMTFKFFLVFEILFSSFWVIIYLINIPVREGLMTLFIYLMLANGIWHLIWFAATKKYVPGLITAPLFILTFLIFYLPSVF